MVDGQDLQKLSNGKTKENWIRANLPIGRPEDERLCADRRIVRIGVRPGLKP